MALEDSRQVFRPGIIKFMPGKPVSTSGVLYPERLPSFYRETASGPVAALVRWFWIPEWRLDPGQTSRQHLIAFPACNLVVEPEKVGISGPTTRASFRDLTGEGWAVGALLQPAAVPALAIDVNGLRDSYVEVDFPYLAARVRAAMNADEPAELRRARAVSTFAAWLRNSLGEPTAEGLLANRLVLAVETEQEILSVGDLAAHLNISTRTLQRLAAKYVGLPPAALIRRRRIQELAERLRTNSDLDLAQLASELGYADHAHLSRECKALLGFTPSSYRRSAPGVVNP